MLFRSGILKKLFGKYHPYIAINYNNLADVYMALQDYQTAKEFYQKSLSIYKKVLGENHADTLFIANKIKDLA